MDWETKPLPILGITAPTANWAYTPFLVLRLVKEKDLKYVFVSALLFENGLLLDAALNFRYLLDAAFGYWKAILM